MVSCASSYSVDCFLANGLGVVFIFGVAIVYETLTGSSISIEARFLGVCMPLSSRFGLWEPLIAFLGTGDLGGSFLKLSG